MPAKAALTRKKRKARPRDKVKYYDDPVKLGRRLRRTREDAGLSQRELSFTGCSAAYISRIEKGERIPSLQLIREFAVRLDVPERYISHGELKDRAPRANLSKRTAMLVRQFGDVPIYKIRLLAKLSKLDGQDLQMLVALTERFQPRGE